MAQVVLDGLRAEDHGGRRPPGGLLPAASRRVIWSSCGVSSSIVAGSGRRTVSPVAASSARARSAHGREPRRSNVSSGALPLGSSSQCASSISTTTGPCSANAASRLSVAAPTAKRSWADPGRSARASSSAAACTSPSAATSSSCTGGRRDWRASMTAGHPRELRREMRVRRMLGRSAEFLGEPYQESFGPADVAEPIPAFVPDHFAADELRTVFMKPGERVVDVVDGEHHA